MSLPANILKEFTKQVINNQDTPPGDLCYGEVTSKTDSGVKVLFDGTPVSDDTDIEAKDSAATPVDCAMDVEPGDRVMVQIINHKAVVVGNVTSPASARTANAYIRLMDAGLIIGNIRDEEAQTYLFLSGDTYYIMERTIDEETGELNDINPEEDTVLTYFKNGNQYFKGSGTIFASESSDPEDPMGHTRIFLDDYDGISIIAHVNRSFATLIIDALSTNPIFRFRGETGTVISKKVLLTGDIYTGSISKTATINANDTATIISDAIDVPIGFTLMGIRNIDQNHTSACLMTSWGVDGAQNKCKASFYNRTNTNQSTTVTFYYFCVRTS